MAQRKNPDFVLRIVLDQLEERAEGRTNSALYRNSDKERKPTDFLLSPGGPSSPLLSGYRYCLIGSKRVRLGHAATGVFGN